MNNNHIEIPKLKHTDLKSPKDSFMRESKFLTKQINYLAEIEEELDRNERKSDINTILATVMIIAVAGALTAIPGVNVLLITIGLICAGVVPTLINMWTATKIHQKKDDVHARRSSLLDQQVIGVEKMSSLIIAEQKNNVDNLESLSELKKLLEKKEQSLDKKRQDLKEKEKELLDREIVLRDERIKLTLEKVRSTSVPTSSSKEQELLRASDKNHQVLSSQTVIDSNSKQAKTEALNNALNKAGKNGEPKETVGSHSSKVIAERSGSSAKLDTDSHIKDDTTTSKESIGKHSDKVIAERIETSKQKEASVAA